MIAKQNQNYNNSNEHSGKVNRQYMKFDYGVVCIVTNETREKKKNANQMRDFARWIICFVGYSGIIVKTQPHFDVIIVCMCVPNHYNNHTKRLHRSRFAITNSKIYINIFYVVRLSSIFRQRTHETGVETVDCNEIMLKEEKKTEEMWRRREKKALNKPPIMSQPKARPKMQTPTENHTNSELTKKHAHTNTHRAMNGKKQSCRIWFASHTATLLLAMHSFLRITFIVCL